MTDSLRTEPDIRGAPTTRRAPLARTLPLLTTGIVVVVVAATLVATRLALTTTALDAAQDRVRGVARQLAAVGDAGVRSVRPRYLAAARDPSVLAAVYGRSDSVTLASVRSALARLQFPTDSGMPVELWDTAGRRVAFIGNDVPFPELAHSTPRLTLDSAALQADALRIGPLYPANGRVHFWFVQPVLHERRVIGFITHQRRLSRNPQTDETLRALSGPKVHAYLRNADGRFWASIAGVVVKRPDGDLATPGTERRRDGQSLVYEDAQVGTSPLVFTVELPRSAVVTLAERPLGKLALIGFVLSLIGGLVSWLIARRLTKPLGDVARAAEAVADGNYGVRVPARGPDEVARLGASFNRMAAEVGASHDALASRETELRALAEAADGANRAKSEFLATMSHELRTPLNAIGGYVELLAMELRGPVTDAQRRDLARIRTSQEHLLGLIAGVLDLSRIESGRVRYDLKSLAVDPVLASLDALVAPQAASKAITLVHAPTAEELTVLADPEKLRQILLNLLSNAIRHTPADGSVTLSATRATNCVEIAVRDTGPGIPRDRHEAIFEPFVQLDRTITNPRDGVGLGLAISRDLARGMVGDLRVESDVGAGARFVLSLPCAPDHAVASMTTSGETAVAERATAAR